MKVKFLDLASQNSEIREELLKVLPEVLDSGHYVSGKFVEKFESKFALAIGTRFAVACNSGTSALYLALTACGIGPGDEVIVPNMTFIATIEAVVQAGATPVVLEVDRLHWNLNSSLLVEAISPKTKAIIFVHLHGNPSGILEVSKVAKQNNLLLIEDVAQAHLAESPIGKAGSIGDVAAFSFYPGKNLGAIGEGGCVTTNSETIFEKVKLIRNWGSKVKYVHEIRGSNYRMDELQAAFLSIKLDKLPEWTKRRQDLAIIYNDFFDKFGIKRPQVQESHKHVYHIYAICVPNRDYLRDLLAKSHIDTGIHYPEAITEIAPWTQFLKHPRDDGTSTDLARNFLSMPISDQLKTVEVDYVVQELDKILSKLS
jgi:dTDP-4-amino-4,6-dideoxygalactose transaminase